MSPYLAAMVGVGILMVSTWLVSLVLRDASIVDLVWGFGFVVVAWVTFFWSGLDTTTNRQIILLALVTAWGLRLSVYLSWRNIGKGEDFRYQAMRKHHGTRFPLISLATVFGLQGVLMWVVSLPVQAGMQTDRSLGVLAGAGVVFWVVGIFFETAGDGQLASFKADPANAGQVMDKGLWRYTRHPNYFGDFMVWWGLYLVGADGGAWWTLVGPAVMTALLMRYSGAGLLEKSIGSRRPGYDDYIRRTNAFFPGPPKS
ncbi:MAG: DUF1295 domain-containing protein [Acidimicrobiia bacterium]|nr:DUF1295 domain-containing protein [Acidimicrobiia bacterium]